MRMLSPILSLFLISLASGVALAQTAPRNPDVISTTSEVTQNDAVRQRYADVATPILAPSLAPGHQGFTTDAEMTAFIDALKAKNPAMQVLPIGLSPQGRAMSVLLFTAEGKATFAEARALARPVLWFVGQQHGNEPAGGEAMLAFAAYLAEPEARKLLEKVTVAIVPRANPDGAAGFRRGAANNADLNRDHLLMFQAETLALHSAIAALPPDVIFDHHEFSVVNRWFEKFGAIQAVDAMVLHATNPMVPAEISAIAGELFRPAVETALKSHGLSMFWYYTTSNLRSDQVVSMGGNNPGIARNAFGLRGAVSFLIETRGVGVRREGWQRRVATHLVAARAVLQASAEQAEKLRAAIDKGRLSAKSASADLIISAKIPANPLVIPLLDPATGADKPVTVPFQDSRVIEPSVTRPRAAAYVIPEGSKEAAERLGLLGVQMCVLAADSELDVVSYAIEAQRAATDRESINPDQAIRANLVRKRVSIKAGAIVVPMAQAAAGIVAATLEPDTPGSYVSTGLIPIPPNQLEAPVYALPAGARLSLRGMDGRDEAACRP
ncbi:M14-like domain containing protein [Rhabdaerophilaceae bacterium]